MADFNPVLQPHVKYIFEKYGIIVADAIVMNEFQIIKALNLMNNDEKITVFNYLSPGWVINPETSDRVLGPLNEVLSLHSYAILIINNEGEITA